VDDEDSLLWCVPLVALALGAIVFLCGVDRRQREAMHLLHRRQREVMQRSVAAREAQARLDAEARAEVVRRYGA
jgi:cytochrome c-type biogenesis protein CcmH/NrfF